MVFFLSSVLISSGLLGYRALPLFRCVLFFPSPYTYARIPVHRIRETRRRCNACVLLGIYDASDIRMERKVVHVCTRICLVRILISNSLEISPTHFFIPLFFPSIFHVRFIDKNLTIDSLVAKFWKLFLDSVKTGERKPVESLSAEREKRRENIQLIFIIRYSLKQTKIRKPDVLLN